jgi:hypothetical protein
MPYNEPSLSKVLLITSISCLTLLSCKENTTTKSIEEIVVRHHENAYTAVPSSIDSTLYSITYHKKKVFHALGLQADNTVDYVLIKEPNILDTFYYLGQKMPCESEKVLTHDSKQYIAHRFLHDLPNEADEEGYFYSINNRIVAFRSLPWQIADIYEFDNIPSNTLLNSDTTGFYRPIKGFEIKKDMQ